MKNIDGFLKASVDTFKQSLGVNINDITPFKPLMSAMNEMFAQLTLSNAAIVEMQTQLKTANEVIAKIQAKGDYAI